ncbi:nanos homolog 1-like [Acipenser ruthenus]|uniref:nanos homolog 1-like n=1 Tax=Acipenser ruthenus TaxID=7906 RepID=UPI00274115DA|nr:nanos homolog 1-like [Acipenser ruthenus]
MDRGNQSFDVWKDYFGLVELLQETRTRGAAGSEPGPEPSPGAAAGMAATQPDRGTKQQSASEVKSPALNQHDPTDGGSKCCVFCKKNVESRKVYNSHSFKDGDKVLCPYLRRYKCPRCGATGDEAHTKRYCPQRNTDYHGPLKRSETGKAPGGAPLQ